MNKKILNIIEKLDWDYTEYEYYACLSKYSNAGEDFSFDFKKPTNTRDLIEAVESYYNDFDPIEHAKMMENCNGAPCLERLIEDAEDIEKDLEVLVLSLNKGKVWDIYAPKKIKALHINPDIKIWKSKKYGWCLEIKNNGELIKKRCWLMNAEEALKEINSFYSSMF